MSDFRLDRVRRAVVCVSMLLLFELVLHGLAVHRLAVVGAHGRLGRELVVTSLRRGWETHAYVRRDEPILHPVRRGGLRERPTIARRPVRDRRLVTHLNAPRVRDPVDALVFCLSGQPFETDRTDSVVARMCASLSPSCRRVCLVSAYGVGDSLRGANAGIQVMSAWYLRDTYRAKREQERIVGELDPLIETLILRPRALSIGSFPLATPRADLARSIADWAAAGGEFSR